jgi:hypothetical protein
LKILVWWFTSAHINCALEHLLPVVGKLATFAHSNAIANVGASFDLLCPFTILTSHPEKSSQAVLQINTARYQIIVLLSV